MLHEQQIAVLAAYMLLGGSYQPWKMLLITLSVVAGGIFQDITLNLEYLSIAFPEALQNQR
jgi:hypothetical protein